MERLQCYRVLCYEVMLHVQLVAGDRERRDAVQLCKPEDDLGRRDIELLCCCDNNRVRQQIRHAPQRPERLICDAIGLAALIHFLIPVVSLVPVVIDDLDGSLTLDGVEGGGAVHVAYANRADGAGVLGSRGGAPCSERVGEPGQWVVQQICLKVVRAQVVQGSDEQWTDLLVAGSYGKDCVWSCPVC